MGKCEMKRVLFYYDNMCHEAAKGGTEVATYRIAKALKDSGKVEVFNAFRNSTPLKNNSVYKDIIKLDRNTSGFKRQLSDFIIKNDIEIIVNMSRFFRHPLISKAIKESGKDVRLLFMQHFAPGSEMKKATYKSGFHLLKLNPLNPIYWLRSTFYPLIKLPRNLKWKKIYKNVYDLSDKVILLSEGYNRDYCRIGGFTDDSKFVSVANIFETPIKSDDIKTKKKRILILSRMDEVQKRISLALKIWQKIELDPDLYDWELDIVGNGHNKDIVKRLIKKLKLERANFHGWQEREPFLESSSILMMTSAYEGLPLSILEAQAYGCVPVAFNSFASLTDIVEPFYNGVVVDKFGDIDDYTKKLTELMYDDSYREELSKNSALSADKFSSERISEKWLKILT